MEAARQGRPPVRVMGVLKQSMQRGQAERSQFRHSPEPILFLVSTGGPFDERWAGSPPEPRRRRGVGGWAQGGVRCAVAFDGRSLRRAVEERRALAARVERRSVVPRSNTSSQRYLLRTRLLERARGVVQGEDLNYGITARVRWVGCFRQTPPSAAGLGGPGRWALGVGFSRAGSPPGRNPRAPRESILGLFLEATTRDPGSPLSRVY